MNPAGTLIYANAASRPILEAIRLEIGSPLPDELDGRLRAAMANPSAGPLELTAGSLTYELWPVDVPEFGFINVYGTDVTAARQIAELNRENERLLLNILPPAIADRLRAGERIIADRFEDSTLLIADIVGFTGLSSELSADQLVELLNEIFSVCDVLIERHGLEKVKTIGDAYWVIGGVPVAVDDHVERVANFALDMATSIDVLQAGRPRQVSFRIGIDRGPLVAGVIGTKRTIYDIWGDTVNLASRMESHGVPGRIHVSHAVYERLRDRYHFESRGLIEIKGKGPLPTYFLLGRLA
jgi:class 3 adenylate cyclase